MFKIKRNYRVNVKAFVKNEKDEMVEVTIPSYETEEVDPAQFIKGLLTDKAITRNEDGSPKEDHTMRNVLIGAAVLVAGGYYMTHKDENQQWQPLPEYQPQSTYQIPQQPTYQSVQQVYQPQPTCTESTYEVPTVAPVETQETSTPNEGVEITVF